MARTKRQTKTPVPDSKPQRPARGEPDKPKSKPRAPGRTKGSGRRKREPRPTGRPTKIDQRVRVNLPQADGKPKEVVMTVAEAVVAVLRSGCSIDTAASVVGIHRTTIYDWIARGEEFRGAEKVPAAERRFSDFADAVTRAREVVVQMALDGILEAGKADWRAYAWFLERSRPDEFGRRTRFELGDGDGGTLTLAELMASAGTDPSSADDADDPDVR